MSSPYRSRIQSLKPRLGSLSEKIPQEQVDCMDNLKVIIPPSTPSPRMVAERGLRPQQTNRRPPLTSSQQEKMKTQSLQQQQQQQQQQQITKSPLPAIMKSPKRPTRQSSKLVKDEDVPNIIKDYRLKRQFKKLEPLGNGGFGRVYRVQSLDNKNYYAIKVIAKSSLTDQKTKSKMLAEINIHRSLKHDNIVKFYCATEDRNNVYLILELCENKTLASMLKQRGGTLTELEVRYYMGQILTALRYMSDNRVLHRDLKLSNILLDRNMDCKLGDFGLSALLLNNEDRKRTICGTLHYIAPEILFNRDGHNHRADMWSAGILMFNLLFGTHPFPHKQPEELRLQVLSNEYGPGFKFPGDSYVVSNEAKDLISKLLVNNPDERLTVIDALRHPFFGMKIPNQIPLSARYNAPSYQELFMTKDTQRSKVTLAIRKARDINENFIDNDVKPPLMILDETILDYRSQYPLGNSQHELQNLQVPSVSASLKKRTASISINKKEEVNDHPSPPKRLCSDPDLKTHSLELKLEKTKIANSDSNEATKSLEPNRVVDSDGFTIPTALPNRRPMMEQMEVNLKIMIGRVESLPNASKTATANPLDSNFEWTGDNLFIETWVDCSKNYGFAYRLSDGTAGFLYNDGSTLTSSDFKSFYYVYHRAQDGRYVEQTYTTIPAELEKKAQVLHKFRAYEEAELKHDQTIPKTTHLTDVYLLKYFVCEEAITFRLSNGVVQLNFFKHHKLVLYDAGKKLLFIDSSRKLTHYNTYDVLTSGHTDVVQAIHYAFSILQEQNKHRKDLLRKQRWRRFQ